MVMSSLSAQEASEVRWIFAMDHPAHGYSGPAIRDLTATTVFGRTAVFVRGNRHPDSASTAIYNRIDLNVDEPIYVWDRNEGVRQQVLEAYPDRPRGFIDGPTIARAAFSYPGAVLMKKAAARFTPIR